MTLLVSKTVKNIHFKVEILFRYQNENPFQDGVTQNSFMLQCLTDYLC